MSTHPWGSEVTQYFYSLTPEKILESVELFKERATGRLFPYNSLENRVYEVEVETEAPVTRPADRYRVLKFYRPGRWTRDQILEEHEFLYDLEAAEIPVITPLKSPAQESLVTLPESQLFCAAFRKQGGRSLQELTSSNAAQVGRLLARLHQVGKAKPFQHRIRLTPQSYAGAALETLRKLNPIPEPWASAYFSNIENLIKIAEPLFAQMVFQRIHGDCHLGNILWLEESLFFVDFDDSVMGHPVQDFWLLLPGRDEEAKRLLDKLLDGYEQMHHFDESGLKMIEVFRALRWVHFNGWIAKRYQDPIFPKYFPEFTSPGYWERQVRDLEDQLEVIAKGNSW